MNDELKQRIENSFAQQTLMKTLGASLYKVAAGQVSIVAPLTNMFCNSTATDMLALRFRLATARLVTLH